MNGETTKQHRRQPRLCIGDLNSGRAFDNNCICFESVNGFRRRECTCNVRIFVLKSQFYIELLIGSKISSCKRIYDSFN